MTDPKIADLIAQVREGIPGMQPTFPYGEPEWFIPSPQQSEDAYAALDRVAAHLEAMEVPCFWTLADWDDEIWQSTCGLVDWCFNEGGPVENRMKFCVGCGHPVKVKEVPHE